jgi:uracil-DNA glycosylase
MKSGAKAQPGQAELAFDRPLPAVPASPVDASGVGASLSAWAPAQWPVAPDWRPLVAHFLDSHTGRQLGCFIDERLTQGAVVYPPRPFRALELTALADVRVVILGQDPYHGPGQAEGLAFSVAPGVRLPPSLSNIFKEIARDPALSHPSAVAMGSGSLLAWARQGVLLINACLTVEQGQPGSHAGHGWEVLTDAIVGAVAARPGPVVFMLWGAHAQAKQALIASVAAQHPGGHLVLTANHPSPLSARRPPKPFIGCGHFSQANLFLQQQGQTAITW